MNNWSHTFIILVFSLLSSFTYPQDNYNERGLDVEPHQKMAAKYLDLGKTSFENKAYKDAQDQFFRALIYDPTSAEAHFLLSKTYLAQDKTADAIRELNSTIVFNAGFMAAYIELANQYIKANKINDAFKIYFKALAQNPLFSLSDNKTIKVNPRRQSEIEALKNSYQNNVLKNKVILIYTDTDIATTILLSRYVFKLKELGAKIIFMPPKSLEDIFKESFKDVDILSWLTLEEDIKFDLKAPLSGLAYIFDEWIEQNYILLPPQKEVKIYESWVSSQKENIAVAWKPQGNLTFFTDIKNNSNLYSLQTQAAETSISELVEDFDSLSNLSGAIAQMDLIISYNYTVAVLAAAMQKNTWLILDSNSEWLWVGYGDRTPWFKNIKIFKNITSKQLEEALLKTKIIP
jgi:tetratricopeptide (TPR) repeat protein